MNYKYILFDLDGTLTDPKEGITKSVQYALRYFGIDVPDLNQLVCFIGPPLLDSFRDFYGFDREKGLVGIQKYREYYLDRGILENRVIPGIPELLEELKAKGFTICLATSKPEPYARQILENFGLIEYFDEAVGCSLDEGKGGTKEDVIREAFKRLHLTDEDKKCTIMIGDRKHDVEAAHACGISAVGMTYGYAPEGELEVYGTDYVFDTVQELKEFLLKE